MTRPNESPASAEAAALRLRQRQIGRQLRLYYERALREPLSGDMLDALIDTDAREATIDPNGSPSAPER